MKIKIWLLRHGMTEGNREQRYVGTTDEPLCDEGRQQILDKRFESRMEFVVVSPMRRCRETASILFPEASQFAVDGFRECSFGEFEYKNYHELNGNREYQAWIDSGGTIGFPGGENQREFCDRVQKTFEKCILDEIIPRAQKCVKKTGLPDTVPEEWQMAMVVHGGTIMAILSQWAVPHKDYFHWQVKNGCGYLVSLDIDEWLAGKPGLSVIAKI